LRLAYPPGGRLPISAPYAPNPLPGLSPIPWPHDNRPGPAHTPWPLPLHPRAPPPPADNKLNYGAILDTAADVAKAMLHLHRHQVL
jgi:hypothetical protein